VDIRGGRLLILQMADIIVMHKVEYGHNDTILNKPSMFRKSSYLSDLPPALCLVEATLLF
jgi:hypothetical protein